MAKSPYRDVQIPTKEELAEACQRELHAKAEKGIHLFNTHQFWHAHEAFEEAWLAEEGPARTLYIGILQAGVTYLQIERNNFIGAAKMYERSQRYLKPLPDHCRGVNVKQLRQDLDAAMKSAGKLGPDRLDEFDTSLLKPISRI
jgi:predicted metal-dependent hydrolase